MKLRHIFILYCLIFGLLCPVFAKPLSLRRFWASVCSTSLVGSWVSLALYPTECA